MGHVLLDGGEARCCVVTDKALGSGCRTLGFLVPALPLMNSKTAVSSAFVLRFPFPLTRERSRMPQYLGEEPTLFYLQ
jgi:hypothetical protein